MKMFLLGIALLCFSIPLKIYCQEQSKIASPDQSLPQRLFLDNRDKSAALDASILKTSSKILSNMESEEMRILKKLSRVDPAAKEKLFSRSKDQYERLKKGVQSRDTTNIHLAASGDYQPYVDSLQGMLGYFKSPKVTMKLPPGLEDATKNLRIVQTDLQYSDQIKDFLRTRRREISDYISLHPGAVGILGKSYGRLNQNIYYYSERIKEYRAQLNDPSKIEKEALAILNKVPAFQVFMKQNSQLASLFNLPSNYGSPETLTGLQSRDQVAALIQQQVAAGGKGGAAALQANLLNGKSQMDQYKDKLSKLGEGNEDGNQPGFKPNEQNTRTFWRRLEYGTNLQTTRVNYYYPTTLDLGLSIAYKLNDRSSILLGAAYKLGLGNGIEHIKFSSNGLALRSGLDIKIKGSFFATGAFEYNYTTPFQDLQQLRHWNDWTKSGLIGITKIVSLKSRVFKKTKAQLLWDFLSYSSIPRTQPLIFRFGYTF